MPLFMMEILMPISEGVINNNCMMGYYLLANIREGNLEKSLEIYRSNIMCKHFPEIKEKLAPLLGKYGYFDFAQELELAPNSIADVVANAIISGVEIPTTYFAANIDVLSTNNTQITLAVAYCLSSQLDKFHRTLDQVKKKYSGLERVVDDALRLMANDNNLDNFSYFVTKLGLTQLRYPSIYDIAANGQHLILEWILSSKLEVFCYHAINHNFRLIKDQKCSALMLSHFRSILDESLFQDLVIYCNSHHDLDILAINDPTDITLKKMLLCGNYDIVRYVLVNLTEKSPTRDIKCLTGSIKLKDRPIMLYIAKQLGCY